MMPAHCSDDIAPVPLSVSRSMTSSARTRNRLNPGSRRMASRCSGVIMRIGSTDRSLMK